MRRDSRTISTPNDMGRALADIRNERGWTQGDLASWSGLNRTYVSTLEAGVPTLALERLMATINTLGYVITLTPKQAPGHDTDDW